VSKAKEVVIAYKGFDSNLKCRGFQYEVGQTYEHTGEVAACSSGFHACEYPLHVLRYYRPSESRFALVEQSGTLARHDEDSKIASSRISIKAEIDIARLIKAAVKYTMDRCTPAPGGNSSKPSTVVKAIGANKAATASGPYGAATASGNSGAATASGRNGKARGKDGCALFLVYRDGGGKIVHAKAAVVGRDGIKPNVWYQLDRVGNFVEVE
jgi:hypothetical protein